MKKSELIKKIKQLVPCHDGYIQHIGKCRTIKQAWNTYEDGSDLIWLIASLNGKQGSSFHRRIVLVACRCARLALVHLMEGDYNPLKDIETAERWARNEEGVTLKMVMQSAHAAHAAAHAAYVAAHAAYVVGNASCAAVYAAYAAYAACAACDTYDAKKTLKQCADIVREEFNLKELLIKLIEKVDANNGQLG